MADLRTTRHRHAPSRLTQFVALVGVTALALVGCSRGASEDTSTSAAPSQSAAAQCTPAKAATTGSSTGKIEVDGTQRDYSINIPPSYDGVSALPLVLNLHGRGGNATQQLLLTGFDTSSDKNNFILVSPNAIGEQWDLPAVPGRATSDTTYITELLTSLEQRLCIDKTRLYAAGMSLGSVMTLALACAPNQSFAAFGGVGASFYRPMCDRSPPAPLIYFHGTADPVVPFEGGKVAGSPAGSITARVNAADENMAAWANHNGCNPTPTVNDLGDTARTIWSDCKNNANVDYYRIDDGGHTWPGANQLVSDFIEERLGKTTQTVDATELMWQFFEQYQLPS